MEKAWLEKEERKSGFGVLEAQKVFVPGRKSSVEQCSGRVVLVGQEVEWMQQ